MKTQRKESVSDGVSGPPKSGRELAIALLRQKSAMERLEPVWAEMVWIMRGRPDQDRHERVLPDYCYSILDVFRRTYFRVMPTRTETFQGDTSGLPKDASLEEVKLHFQVNWDALGRMIGIVMRGLRLIGMESEGILKRDGFLDLKPEEERDFVDLVFGRRWIERKGLQRLFDEEAESAGEVVEQRVNELGKTLSLLLSSSNQLALLWGPTAMADLASGVSKGMTGFLDADAHLVGESVRANNYVFLLVCWPEIKAMQESRPPKSRTDFAKWVEPFAKDDLVSLRDLDQIRDVCDDIGLKFKGRGRSKKSR